MHHAGRVFNARASWQPFWVQIPCLPSFTQLCKRFVTA